MESSNIIQRIEEQIFCHGKFEKLSAKEREVLMTCLKPFENLIDKFFLPFEEEQLLIDRGKYEKFTHNTLGEVLIISGPSGVGKDTAISKLMELNQQILKVVTATTREPRNQETEGVDYHFLNEMDFSMLLQARMFLHRAKYAENLYGIPKTELRKRVNSSAIVLNIAGEGVKIIKRLIPEVKSIIILPPNETAQLKRLKERGTETKAQILARIHQDKEIFKDHKDLYDHTIISEDGDISSIVEQINAIIKK